MFSILNSLQAVPRVASTAAVTTFRTGLLRAVRGYSSDTTSGNLKTGEIRPLDIVSDGEETHLELSSEEELNLEKHNLPDTELVIKYLHEENMNRAELLKEELKRVRLEFKMHDVDTGSSAVQVATLTTKIKSLSEHLNQHRKDQSSKLGLMSKLSQRQKLLKYIRRTQPDVYQDLIRKLGLKDRTFVGSRYYK